MSVDRVALKQDAKQAIRDSAKSPYLTALVYVVIIYVLAWLNNRITGIVIDMNTYRSMVTSGDYTAFASYILANRTGAAAQLIGVLLQIMTMMMGVGMTLAMLQVHRRQEHSIGTLFDGFAIFVRVFLLELVMYIFIFLWSLLFIVPGIIAAYRYRQALYLLLDHPEMGVMDCIRESKRLMTGHKGELFVVDLSFLGWYILCAVPFVSVYVTPYVNVTYAGYYDALVSGDAYARSQTPPQNY